MDIYQFTVEDAQGKKVSLQEYSGKVLLIVNTATGCGFTPQYEGLEKLYETYRERGFEILDFPCNQFRNQAPGTNEEIVSFCQLTYGVSFKTFSKIKVNGPESEPLFAYLKQEAAAAQEGGIKKQLSRLIGHEIKWNFTKFLIDREGKVVARYAPSTAPEKISEDIERLL